MQFNFGTGSLYAAATQTGAGATIAVPTYIKFGALQGVGVDFERDIKELWGQQVYPLYLGGGKMKTTVKAKFAQISGRIFNDLFIGGNITSGQSIIYDDLTGQVIPATPYTVTITPPASGTLDRVLAVLDSNGLPMTKVASGPTTGQYSISGGTLTFAAADTGKTVYISYTYTLSGASAPTAKTLAIGNPLMGSLPLFGMEFGTSLGGKSATVRFPNCAASKFSFDPKQDDFTENNLDIKIFADPVTGSAATMSWSE